MEIEKALKNSVTEKLVFIHTLIILGVVVCFGIVNIVNDAFVFGILIIVAGALVCGAVRLLKNKVDRATRGTILSIAQLIIIIVMSSLQHELGIMFALILASMAIAAIYYSMKTLYIHWGIATVVTTLGLFMNDFFYGGENLEFLIKGLAGVHIGSFLIVYLEKCSISFITNTQKAKAEADELLDRVQEQMNETEEMSRHQTKVVEEIAKISHAVNTSADKMLDIAHDINSAADDQQKSIALIAEDINTITSETQSSLLEAEKAESAAMRSSELLIQNNAEMQNMLTAYAEIEDSSAQIRNIVATIEDIAFQTNILALNASIEAARAGEAGKGFAVVADEVRNLANKSQEAVSNTAALIDSSLDAVRRGKEIADAVAERMTAVISTAEESAEHSRIITGMTEKQNNAAAAAKERMEQISSVITKTTVTSEHSTAIAGEVSDNARKLDEVVRSFN